MLNSRVVRRNDKYMFLRLQTRSVAPNVYMNCHDKAKVLNIFCTLRWPKWTGSRPGSSQHLNYIRSIQKAPDYEITLQSQRSHGIRHTLSTCSVWSSLLKSVSFRRRRNSSRVKEVPFGETTRPRPLEAPR